MAKLTQAPAPKKNMVGWIIAWSLQILGIFTVLHTTGMLMPGFLIAVIGILMIMGGDKLMYRHLAGK